MKSIVSFFPSTKTFITVFIFIMFLPSCSCSDCHLMDNNNSSYSLFTWSSLKPTKAAYIAGINTAATYFAGNDTQKQQGKNNCIVCKTPHYNIQAEIPMNQCTAEDQHEVHDNEDEERHLHIDMPGIIRIGLFLIFVLIII